MRRQTLLFEFGPHDAEPAHRQVPRKVVMKKPLWILVAMLCFSVSTCGQDLDGKLLEAAKARNTAEVQRLLGEGADANAKDNAGWTALIWAAYFGRNDTVRALLEKGADVNAKGKDGITALMNAASADYRDIVHALLEKGAHVNAKDNDGWTPLFWAAFSGRAEIVRALLEKGADVNAMDDSGKTVLMSAAVRGHASTVRALLEKGADVNAKSKTGRTALMSAADLGHLDTVRALLEQGADVDAKDKKGDTALRLAEKYKYSSIVALLRRAPPMPPKTGIKNRTASVPTTSPAATGPPAASELQPASSAPAGSQDLNKKLLDAAEAGDTAEVQSLLREGANPHAKGGYGNTALMGAAVRGHTETVRALLDKGAEVNAKGNTGRTALMEAALEGYTETVRTLLEKGAEVNAKDNAGWTPLFWAAFSRRTDTVRALLEKGADVNAKNKYDDTALIHAAYAGDTDTVVVLLEKGAEVNARDDMGKTALIEAARQGRTETVRALLQGGADITVRDRDGETALSGAEQHNYSDVIALLKAPPGLQSQKPKKPSTGIPDAPPGVTAPTSAPVPTGDEGLEKELAAQSFYRLGLNMRLMEVLWSHPGELAARCAVNLQQDLQKVAAPSDLMELANRAAIQLNLRPEERPDSVPILIRELRVRLDKLCKAQTEEQFFCAAGGFTYDLSLFGEDVKDPGHAKVSIEDGRRKTLLLVSALAAQCSATAGCKERALLYFSAVTNILKKEQLGPADGSLLVTVSENIGKALSSDER
ncbi:MAG: hypothetical protein AUF67_08710 [Acidobacteria bacterium 13_1_20CM_58_21]|nr:MAG: hypothetical protein AUF67_08710 [Acidobacteria bacterium 13_1_20CM_58_21]